MKSDKKATKKEKEIEKAIDRELNDYGRTLRQAQLAFIKRINMRSATFSRDPLMRRAYLGSLYNVCTSALLQRPEFADLSLYFPSLKLPLTVGTEDLEAFESSYIGRMHLKELLKKYIAAYSFNQNTNAEVHLRIGLWSPLLTDILSYVSSKNQGPDIISLNKMRTEEFDPTSLSKYIDFTACPRDSGMPILLVEISEPQTEVETTHKDMKNLSISMVFALSELINRAGIICPDEDLTKFRVYGILISGRAFELCVCTVVKGADGLFGFVFHSNEFHWKFTLYGEELTIPDEEALKAADFICDGDRSVLGTFKDMEASMDIKRFDFGGIVQETDFEKLLAGSSKLEKHNESQFSQRFEESMMEKTVNSLIILIKFCNELALYYKELPDALQSAYVTEPDFTSNDSLIVKFPKGLPHYPKSQAKNIKTTKRSECLIHKIVESGTAQHKMYLLQYIKPNPTLPDVLFFYYESGVVTIRNHDLEIIDFSRNASENYLDDVLEIYIAKMILDMYLAVLAIHSKGFVCGGVEPQFIVFDNVHFRFSDLPRLQRIPEAHLVDVEKIEDYQYACHIPNSRLSIRDDLSGVARAVENSLRSTMSDIMNNRESFPHLMRFFKVSWIKLYEYNNYANVDPIELLEQSADIFKEMYERLDHNALMTHSKKGDTNHLSIKVPLIMTYDLAMQTAQQLKEESTKSNVSDNTCKTD